MNRNESSRLGDLQAEGNLGNERNRRSVRDGSREWHEAQTENISSRRMRWRVESPV